MRAVQRRIVSGFIVSSDGKVLLGRKDPSKGGVYPDCWHNPGGGVKIEESDEAALIREILEETGIDIRTAEKILIDNQIIDETAKTLPTGEKILVQMRFYIYKVVLHQKAHAVEKIPSSDLVELQWFPVEELEHIKLTPPAIKLLVLRGSDWLSGAYK